MAAPQIRAALKTAGYPFPFPGIPQIDHMVKAHVQKNLPVFV
jgi:hypothetical protein